MLVILTTLVSDGWSGRPSALVHQILLLPVTVMFALALYKLLFSAEVPGFLRDYSWSPRASLALTVFWEVSFIGLFVYEARHFRRLGYHLYVGPTILIFGSAVIGLSILALRRLSTGMETFSACLCVYATGLLLSIYSFPLTYLRSDMLPVIQWADTNLLRGVSPYTRILIADRIYDFPYLPGMLVSFLPFQALHVDLRYGCLLFVLGTAGTFFFATQREARPSVAALLAVLLLCPFLQYRHELYIEPHWFALVGACLLLHRRHFVVGAFVFGLSMAIYQFSWILFPFVLLNGLRRGSWLEVLKQALAGIAGMLLIVAPFLEQASRRIANNTVGQWSHLKHASADVINLSFWATFVVPPAHLLHLQIAVWAAIFGYCLSRDRCRDLADTLRWMCLSLAAFISMNVLVDGYFYLLLLVLLLVYVCVVNGWWEVGKEAGARTREATWFAESFRPNARA